MWYVYFRAVRAGGRLHEEDHFSVHCIKSEEV